MDEELGKAINQRDQMVRDKPKAMGQGEPANVALGDPRPHHDTAGYALQEIL